MSVEKVVFASVVEQLSEFIKNASSMDANNEVIIYYMAANMKLDTAYDRVVLEGIVDSIPATSGYRSLLINRIDEYRSGKHTFTGDDRIAKQYISDRCSHRIEELQKECDEHKAIVKKLSRRLKKAEKKVTKLEKAAENAAEAQPDSENEALRAKISELEEKLIAADQAANAAITLVDNACLNAHNVYDGVNPQTLKIDNPIAFINDFTKRICKVENILKKNPKFDTNFKYTYMLGYTCMKYSDVGLHGMKNKRPSRLVMAMMLDIPVELVKIFSINDAEDDVCNLVYKHVKVYGTPQFDKNELIMDVLREGILSKQIMAYCAMHHAPAELIKQGIIIPDIYAHMSEMSKYL
jgi:flagellar biosynthesis GTPase FlhF